MLLFREQQSEFLERGPFLGGYLPRIVRRGDVNVDIAAPATAVPRRLPRLARRCLDCPRAGASILEFGRLLKPGGQLILTVPSNSLRHQDPYYFVAGYSDHYLRYWLEKAGFGDMKIEPQGDYHRWLMCEYRILPLPVLIQDYK